MESTETKRLELIQKLAVTEERQVLGQIEKILDRSGRISIEQYNKELDEADAEMDRGESISHEALKTQMKNWPARYL